MIPKVIHYCWFGGGEKPKLVKKCISSWVKLCPDYQIVEWNEDKCDFTRAPLFVRQAVSRGKWGFVSDYFRSMIVFQNGGIYLDTDVELIRRPDSLLRDPAFYGFHNGLIGSGVGFGAEKGRSLQRELMAIYENISFLLPDGTMDLTPCTVRETPIFVRHGLIRDNSEQILDDGTRIYPKEYLDPGNWGSYYVYKTEHTISVHHYMSSWYSKADKRKYIRAKNRDFVLQMPRYVLFRILGRDKMTKVISRLKNRDDVS